MTKLATWAIWLRYLHIQAKHDTWVIRHHSFCHIERMARTVLQHFGFAFTIPCKQLQLMKRLTPIPQIEIQPALTLPYTQYVNLWLFSVISDISVTQ